MSKHNPKTALFFLLASAMSAPVVLAQSSDQESRAQDDQVEEIIVTGSRIKRRDFFTPSPLMTVNKEEIEFSGQSTLEATLNQMPQVTPDSDRASNNPGTGTATVALRNLGPGRTLVLLNGRRFGPSKTGATTGSAADINNIPKALIERIEIITGGTSAVYGADALAGVVNFITRDDYAGVGIDASGSVTERGDSESYDVSLTYGHNFENNRGNVAVYAGWYRREASYQSSREHTRVSWGEDGQGNLVEGGSGAIPATHVWWPPLFWPDDPEADLPRTTFDDNGNPRQFIEPDDWYNYAPENYLQVPLDRQALGLFGHYRFADSVEGYWEAMYTHNEPAAALAPTPGFGWISVNLDNPVLTPATRDLFTNQFACDVNLACLYIGKRFVELGPRLIDQENDYVRITSGVRGEFGRNWEFDAWVNYTRSSWMVLLANDVSRSRVQQGLLVDPVTGQCTDPSGNCVPVDLFGTNRMSAEAVDFIRYADFENPSTRTHQLAAVVVSGSPLTLWAGNLDIAAGLEWRRDESHFDTDEALFSRDQFGYDAQSPGGGDDRVMEIYAEAVVPLMSNRSWAQYLGLEVGGRYSDYRYADGVWTYKAGVEWQPTDAIRLRAMHQRSVRAPNSFELFEEQRSYTTLIQRINDPCTASQDPLSRGPSLVEKCVLQGLPEDQVGTWEAADYYPVEVVSGGDPEVNPEVGRTMTVGAVLAPAWLPDWQFAVDYYDLEVNGTISPIYGYIVCFDEQNIQHIFCDRVTRDESGHIANVIELTGNKGNMSTQGFDVQAQYQFELPDSLAVGRRTASVDVNLIWTHLLSFKDQENPAVQAVECAGYFGAACDTSASTWRGSPTTFTKDRVRASAHYSSGPFSAHLAWRWIRGSKNQGWYRPPEERVYDDIAVKSVPDKQYVDLSFEYDFSPQLSARLGIENALDTDPPVMSDSWVFGLNTDAGLYDVFGRSYYLTLSARY